MAKVLEACNINRAKQGLRPFSSMMQSTERGRRLVRAWAGF